MKKGDIVLVCINPDEPDDFMSDPAGGFVYAMIGIVIIPADIGGIGSNISKNL